MFIYISRYITIMKAQGKELEVFSNSNIKAAEWLIASAVDDI